MAASPLWLHRDGGWLWGLTHALIQSPDPVKASGGRTLYGHFSCAEALVQQGKLELQPPVCKHFERRGFCLAGDACFFRCVSVGDGRCTRLHGSSL